MAKIMLLLVIIFHQNYVSGLSPSKGNFIENTERRSSKIAVNLRHLFTPQAGTTVNSEEMRDLNPHSNFIKSVNKLQRIAPMDINL
jgi:hypothetical protein